MESLKELYKFGPGPSSSHTIAPMRALHLFLAKFPMSKSLTINLYGSLSLTGKGHFTDVILIESSPIPCSVHFKLEWDYDYPNGLTITNEADDQWVVYSLGGGSIQILNENFDFQKPIYPESSFEEIVEFCNRKKFSLIDYVLFYEPYIRDYLAIILEEMMDSVRHGLEVEGILPGPLKVTRIAKELYRKANTYEVVSEREKLCLSAYAYAVMEENASMHTVVTAPTCGSSGVLAGVIYFLKEHRNILNDQLIDALIVGGIFGNLVKQNATISGAQGGCQAEIGVGCAMAAAAVTSLSSHYFSIIEYAAEIGIEHHLGLTCDPVGGYVIIPCIERNAVAAQRALDASFMAINIGSIRQNRISFDMVVSTMNETGEKIAVELKETSLGGLASIYKFDEDTKR